MFQKENKTETLSLSLPSYLANNIKALAEYERVSFEKMIIQLLAIGITNYEEELSDSEWKVLHRGL